MGIKWAEMDLPKGFVVDDFWRGPSFRAGINLLNDYCAGCAKNNDCDDYENTKQAMGENYPYWPSIFVPVRDERVDFFSRTISTTVCADYESPQLTFPGMEGGQSDAARRLLEVNPSKIFDSEALFKFVEGDEGQLEAELNEHNNF